MSFKMESIQLSFGDKTKEIQPYALHELEVVKGAEHMLTPKPFSPLTFNQIIRFII